MSYTEARTKREEFRRNLVTWIMTDSEPNTDVTDIFPNSDERTILKYYHYIRHGVDIVNIAPIHKKVLVR